MTIYLASLFHSVIPMDIITKYNVTGKLMFVGAQTSLELKCQGQKQEDNQIALFK